jgi:N-methylhydantoinase A/oxoprolinase/acetone carboxylase beta subunit
LEASIRIDGPTIIQEKTSTAVVCPRQKAEVDEFLNLKVQLEDSK